MWSLVPEVKAATSRSRVDLVFTRSLRSHRVCWCQFLFNQPETSISCFPNSKNEAQANHDVLRDHRGYLSSFHSSQFHLHFLPTRHQGKDNSTKSDRHTTSPRCRSSVVATSRPMLTPPSLSVTLASTRSMLSAATMAKTVSAVDQLSENGSNSPGLISSQ